MNIVDLIPELSQDQNKYKVHFAIGYKGVPKKKPLYLFIKDEFQEWQNEQNDRNFERDYILSFVYFEKDEWLFVGVYKRISLKQIGKRNFKYKTELTNIGSELIGRLIIKYAKNYRATYVTFERYSKYFELLEILKERFSIEPFPGYENLIVDYSYLKTIFEKNDKSWESALKSVKGIYLIVDKTTGQQYVGSAYGEDAIWHRWKEYSQSGHGGNKELIKLLKHKGEEHKQNFQFSILQILSKTSDDAEIINQESLWKDKILSRKFGLNSN